MEYTVLARKCRPKIFEDIIGQESITRILKNAIRKKRVAHAYIFSGPRGVGKTSTARVLAKALNCVNGPTDTPCNECTNCKEINEGINMDVIEIDGASNRGIDNIRELRENVKFTPVNSPYKIYIIDEVHMLSKEAFNALLKTLEEPPAHIKFIFATTEPHKIPETILSRCQHFQFSLIPKETIKQRLIEILEEEQISFDEKAIDLIAKSAQGSMRDAQSILDKVITYCNETITYKDAVDIIGIIDEELLYKITLSIVEKNPKEAYNSIQNIIKENKDAFKAVQDIINFLEQILLEKINKNQETHSDIKIKELSEKFKLEEIIGAMEVFAELESRIKTSYTPYTLLEMAVLKLAASGGVVPTEHILKELHGIKKYLTTSASPSSIQKKNENSINQDEKEPKEIKVKEIKPLINQIKDRWPNFLNLLEKKNHHLLKLHLSEGKVKELKENILTLEFDESSMFNLSLLQEPKNITLVEEELSLYFDTPLKIKFEITQQSEIKPETSIISRKPYDPNEKIKKVINENKIVKKTLEIFEDSKIVGYKEL